MIPPINVFLFYATVLKCPVAILEEGGVSGKKHVQGIIVIQTGKYKIIKTVIFLVEFLERVKTTFVFIIETVFSEYSFGLFLPYLFIKNFIGMGSGWRHNPFSKSEG